MGLWIASCIAQTANLPPISVTMMSPISPTSDVIVTRKGGEIQSGLCKTKLWSDSCIL